MTRGNFDDSIHQAQRFETGGSSGGYTVSAIVLHATVLPTGTPPPVEVSIREHDDDSGEPGDVVARLTNPAAIVLGRNTFTATGRVVLDADETYWVHVSNGGYDTVGIAFQNVNASDGHRGQPGWSIERGKLRRSLHSDSWSTSNNILLAMAIHGGSLSSANTAATGAPSISGPAAVRGTLTAGPGTIADADGRPAAFPDDYALQWTREDADGTNRTDIEGATSATYELTAADEGKKIRVRTSFTDDAGVSEGPLESAAHPASGTVAANSQATGAPAVTGTAVVGRTLTAGRGTIADADGLPDMFPDGYTFQWTREDADGSNAADIPGATSATYVLAAADEGKKIRVRTSFTDDAGVSEGPLESAAYPASGTVAPNSTATGAPSISGAAVVGRTLTAGSGTIADLDGLPAAFPGGYTFQWVREDAGGTNAADIEGATSATYVLTAADAGSKVRVRASFTDGDGNEEGPLESAAYPRGDGHRCDARPARRDDGSVGLGAGSIRTGHGRRLPAADRHERLFARDGRRHRQLRRGGPAGRAQQRPRGHPGPEVCPDLQGAGLHRSDRRHREHEHVVRRHGGRDLLAGRGEGRGRLRGPL